MTSPLSAIYSQALYPSEEGGYMLQHNQYPDSEQLFIPYRKEGTEYHFVDYRDKDKCRWVRTPSQTLEEVGNIINFIQTSNKNVEDFRILPEDWLSKLKETWCADKKCYKLEKYTNRVALFGNREESFAEKFFGEESLSQKWNESEEEWISRITKLQENGDQRLEFVDLNFSCEEESA